MNFEYLNNEGNTFVREVLAQLDRLVNSGKPILRMNISGEALWDCYLSNIPAEYNPIFRERPYFDGNYDKNFIRRIGNIAVLHEDLHLETLWDFKSETFFESVREELRILVRNADIENKFLEKERTAGHKPNYDEKDPSILWTHFFVELPKELVEPRYKEEILGKVADAHHVFKRSMEEVTIENLETVLDLLNENALYRGTEFKDKLTAWLEDKKKYDTFSNSEKRNRYLWYRAYTNGQHIGYRASVIGTLVTDLYNGVDLEAAVNAYESKVAPTNYKRPKAVVTPRMVEDAKNTLSELGLLDAVYRRAANLTDIPGDKILFASKKEKALDILTDILDEAKASTKNVSPEKAKDISVDEFLNALPNCDLVEILPTGKILQNQMALTTCDYDTKESIFPWSSPLSWAYVRNDTADAITERVKNAGGNVAGDIRFSLAWNNIDDLDLFVKQLCSTYRPETGTYHTKDSIWYGDRHRFGGSLDVDANACTSDITNTPVENIYWNRFNAMPDGEYLVGVNQFNCRTKQDQGFKLQVAIHGEITTYTMDYNNMREKNLLHVTKLNGAITVNVIHKDLKKENEIISEKTFIPVSKILTSPNTWENPVGNKHLFLLTENFNVEQAVRGFFNEQLKPSLTPHRKVMEILGTKLKIEASEFNKPGVAKGYGFSETKDAGFTLRLTYTNGRKELVNVHIK